MTSSWVATLEAREGTSAFYYFDLLVVNQHEVCLPFPPHVHVCREQSTIVPFEQLKHEFGQSVRAIGRTLLYLRWANPIPLGRAGACLR